jgi:hypothetical protein
MPKDARKAGVKRSVKSCEVDQDLVVEAILPSFKFNSNPASNKIGKFKAPSNKEPVFPGKRANGINMSEKVKTSTVVKRAEKAKQAQQANKANKANKAKKAKKAKKARTAAVNGPK